MWTTSTRSRVATIEKKTKRYPSDLTDEEWSSLEPLLPQHSGRGRKRTTDLREVANALRYMVRSGCEWRMLPVHFPPRQTVYWWFRRFVRSLLFRTIHDVARMIDRERAGGAMQQPVIHRASHQCYRNVRSRHAEAHIAITADFGHHSEGCSTSDRKTRE